MVRSSRHAGAAAVLAVAAFIAAAPLAYAHGEVAEDPLDTIPAAPKAFDGIKVDEHLGAQLPLALRFRDEQGQAVTLGQVINGKLPVILSFNYSDCPMLCSFQLNALVASLPQLSLAVGKQFQIVTVILNPNEAPSRATETKAKYVGLLPAPLQAAARQGWHFLVAPTAGDDASVKALAAVVGFGYRYLPERAEYAHPAALILLSPGGKVTRYAYGIDFPAAELQESIIRAGTAEQSASTGFILSCFHYDADANNYSRMGMTILRYGAIGFLALLFAGFGTWQLIRGKHKRLASPPGAFRS